MIRIEEKSKCNGCHACYNVCPKNCITMSNDNEGFLYPVVDEERCINCGLCEKTCPTLQQYAANEKGKAYACKNKNEDIRLKSSSGGVFTLIAEYVIKNNGVVFGAGFDDEFNVCHMAADNIDDLYKFRGSKYVQSVIGDTYKHAKRLLDSGKTVLFTGTPCQIGGLKQYLGKEYENLITQDIICHGVPSPKVWNKYVKSMEENQGGALRSVSFRNKKHGWKAYRVAFEFENNRMYCETLRNDLYMKAFLKNIILRPSCYDCYFKSLERQSDLTLADFWGLQNVLPEFDDDKGTSLVFVNSQKGREIFENIKEYMDFKSADIDLAVSYNTAAVKSCEMPRIRKKFFKEIEKTPVLKLINKCTRIPLKKRAERFVLYVPRKIKRIFK